MFEAEIFVAWMPQLSLFGHIHGVFRDKLLSHFWLIGLKACL